MKKNQARSAAGAKSPEQKRAASKAAALRRNPDGVHRAAHSGHCRHCDAHVFAGLDAEKCALSVLVDSAPLSAVGEVLALMTGRETYSLTWFGSRGRYEIERRDQYNIESQAPGTNVNIDIVAGHQCDSPPLPRLSTMIKRQSAIVNNPIEPPF